MANQSVVSGQWSVEIVSLLNCFIVINSNEAMEQ